MNLYFLDASAINPQLEIKYKEMGINIVNSPESFSNNLDIVISSEIPNIELKNCVLIGTFDPYRNKDKLLEISKNNVIVLSLDMIVRSTKAQYMDVLSSRANLAGYKAVIFAANELDKTIPMLITSAGTLAASKFLIIGAGVAGLQAIATARRLGAKVSAFDVREAAKEQVESLGAKFISVENTESNNGVYAQETTDEYKKRQALKLLEVLKDQDVVITTAQIPGRPAPKIITQEMIDIMKPDAIIIDLAAKSGGNCVDSDKVKIFKFNNILSLIPETAALLYSKNIFNFIKHYKQAIENNTDIEADEIIKSVLVAKNGEIINDRLK